MSPPNDHGVVAVIDGEVIKVTPFRAANMPPPMALHEIAVGVSIKDVALNMETSSIAILHQQGISVFEWKNISASGSPPSLIGRYTFEKDEVAQSHYQQICFADDNDILALHRHGSASFITRFGFNEDTGRMDRKAHEETHSSTIVTLSNYSVDGSTHAYAQDLVGNLHSLKSGDLSLASCNFPTVLPWVEILFDDDMQIAFGMATNGHLYANSRLLVKNCTSFLVTPVHLIFTTTTHFVKFVHVTDFNGMTIFCTKCHTKLILNSSRSTCG